MDYYAQAGYRCRLEWGRDGARRAAARGDVVVVVDVLSFSTAVATAVQYGGIIRPCGGDETPSVLAASTGSEIAVRREEVPALGRFSLSPLSFIGMEPGTSVVLASPNGATCCRCGNDTPYLLAGALLNARSVAEAASGLIQGNHRAITVVAAGERWETPGEDGGLRVAIEDYLGAGAIISRITAAKSPEATLCELAFRSAEPRLAEMILACGSGVELAERGYRGDAEHAARLDLYDTVPVLRAGRFEKMDQHETAQGGLWPPWAL